VRKQIRDWKAASSGSPWALHKMSPNLAKELQTSKTSLWTLRVATNHTEIAQILSVNGQGFCRWSNKYFTFPTTLFKIHDLGSNIVIPSSKKHPKTLIGMKNLGSHSSFLTYENLLQSNSIKYIYRTFLRVRVGVVWIPRRGGARQPRKQCKTKATRAGPDSKLPDGPAPEKN